MAFRLCDLRKQVLDFNTNHTFKNAPHSVIPSSKKLDDLFHTWSRWALGDGEVNKRGLTNRIYGLRKLKTPGCEIAGKLLTDRIRLCTAAVDYLFVMYDSTLNVEVNRGVDPELAKPRCWRICFPLYKWLIKTWLTTAEIAECFADVKSWFLNRNLRSSLPTSDRWHNAKPLWTFVNSLLNLQWNDGDLYRVLYQSCVFFERLNLEALSNDEQLDAYAQFEENLSSLGIAESGVLSEMREIASRYLKIPDPERLKQIFLSNCIIGPGSTSTCEGAYPADKYNQLKIMPKTAYVLKKYDLLSSLPYQFKVSDEDYYNQINPVPKNMKVKRIIGMEANGLMPIQHGWRAVMNWSIKHSPLSSHALKPSFKRLDIGDEQQLSRIEALRGSQDGTFCTFDLSAASDWITVDKVKAIYPKDIAAILLSARTSYSRLNYSGANTREIKLQKFACMGSDLCFVNLTIFCCLACEVAIRRYNRRVHTHWYAYEESLYRVVGDDITIETIFAEDLKCVLQELGMVVNVDKSYYNDDGKEFIFREACGMEAINGVPLDPYRLSRKYFMHLPNIDNSHSEELSRRVAEVNAMFEHDYFTARKWLIHLLKRTSADVTVFKHRAIEVPYDVGEYGHCRVAETHSVPSIWRFIPFIYWEETGMGIKTYNPTGNNWHMRQLASRTNWDIKKTYQGFVLKYHNPDWLESAQLRAYDLGITIGEYVSTAMSADYDVYWVKHSPWFEESARFKHDNWSYDPDHEYTTARRSLDCMPTEVWHLTLGPVQA